MFLAALLAAAASAQSTTLEMPIGQVYNALGIPFTGTHTPALYLYDDSDVQLVSRTGVSTDFDEDGALMVFEDIEVDLLEQAATGTFGFDGTGPMATRFDVDVSLLLACPDADPEVVLFSDDLDGDGFGGSIHNAVVVDAAVTIEAWAPVQTLGCTASPVPAGLANNHDDCDDRRADAFPGAVEYCNGGDDDCDGLIDEDGAVNGWGGFIDSDLDGYGDQPAPTCSPAAELVPIGGDCDDADADVNPGAEERCDDIDHDCSGDPYDADYSPLRWYPDADGDGWGDEVDGIAACVAPENSMVDRTGDCDDEDPTISPAADELCDDFDWDCDEHPTWGAIDAPTWLRDEDGDGWGNASRESVRCEQPDGYVSRAGDCDDWDASVNPDAPDDDLGERDLDCDGEPPDATDAAGCSCATATPTPLRAGGLLALLTLLTRRRR